MFTKEQKKRVEILKFESKKKIPVELKKKKARVQKERTLTSCVVNRCLHSTDTSLCSKVVVCWLPNIVDVFFSLGRLIEDLERQLSSASYDSSEFLFWRRDEYKRTLATDRSLCSKVVVCWLPNIAYFFFSLGRLIEDLERQLRPVSNVVLLPC